MTCICLLSFGFWCDQKWIVAFSVGQGKNMSPYCRCTDLKKDSNCYSFAWKYLTNGESIAFVVVSVPNCQVPMLIFLYNFFQAHFSVQFFFCQKSYESNSHLQITHSGFVLKPTSQIVLFFTKFLSLSVCVLSELMAWC